MDDFVIIDEILYKQRILHIQEIKDGMRCPRIPFWKQIVKLREAKVSERGKRKRYQASLIGILAEQKLEQKLGEKIEGKSEKTEMLKESIKAKSEKIEEYERKRIDKSIQRAMRILNKSIGLPDMIWKPVIKSPFFQSYAKPDFLLRTPSGLFLLEFKMKSSITQDDVRQGIIYNSIIRKFGGSLSFFRVYPENADDRIQLDKIDGVILLNARDGRVKIIQEVIEEETVRNIWLSKEAVLKAYYEKDMNCVFNVKPNRKYCDKCPYYKFCRGRRWNGVEIDFIPPTLLLAENIVMKKDVNGELNLSIEEMKHFIERVQEELLEYWKPLFKITKVRVIANKEEKVMEINTLPFEVVENTSVFLQKTRRKVSEAFAEWKKF